MIIKKFSEVEKKPVLTQGAEKVSIRWLIGKDSGAPNFYMRLFELEPGGHTPFHHHANEHEVYILEGEGQIRTDKLPVSIGSGTFALVPGGVMHCFENTGSSLLRFLCLVPRED